MKRKRKGKDMNRKEERARVGGTSAPPLGEPRAPSVEEVGLVITMPADDSPQDSPRPGAACRAQVCISGGVEHGYSARGEQRDLGL